MGSQLFSLRPINISTTPNYPYNCTDINGNVFNNCDNLTSVTFAVTSGWKASLHGSQYISISSNDLADPKKAAELLTTTYLDYDFYRE